MSTVDVGRAQGHLDLDIKNWGSKLKSAMTELQTFKASSTAMTGKLLTQQGKMISGVGDKLTKSITKPALVAGAALAGITIAKGFKRMEMLDNAKRKLEALGNSGKDVQSIMATVGTVVDKTAYTSAEAVSVAAGAVGAGIEKGEKLEKYLSAVGDAAAIAGTDFQSMGAIFNKVAARGKVTSREIMQLSNTGIPAFNLLAKATGKSMEEVQAAVKKGEIGVDDLVKAINVGMPNAARVIGSKTIQGAITNINAYIGKMGEAFLGATDDANSFAGKLLPILNNLVDWMSKEGVDAAKKFGAGLGSAFENIVNFFTNTPKGLLKFGAVFALSAGPILKMVGALTQARGAVLTYQATTQGASLVQGVLNGQLTLGQAIWGGLTTSQATATATLEANTVAVETETVAMAAEAGATEAATVAQNGLNASLLANPFVLAATGAAVLGAAIFSLVKQYQGLDGSQTEVYKSFKDSQAQRQEAITSIEAQAVSAGRYADKIEQLNKKEKLSNSEKTKMKAYVDALNQAMGETVVTIDEETGKVVESTSKIRDKIAALKEEAQAQAYASNYQAAVQEEINLQDQRVEKYKEIIQYKKEAAQGGWDKSEIGHLQELQTEYNGIKKALQENGAEQDKWAEKIDGGNKKAEQSTKKATKNIEKASNDMAKNQKKAGHDAASNMAKAMEMKEAQRKAKTSGGKIVSNVKDPLSKANLSPFGDKMGNQFTNALGKAKSKQAGQKVGANAKTGLDNGSKGAKSAGSFFGQGFFNGIKAWWSKATTAGYKLGKAAESGLKQGTDEASPSKSAKLAGKYFGEGFNIGINGHKMTVETSAKKLGKNAVNGLKKAVKEHNFSEVGSNMVDKFSEGIDKRIEKAKKSAKKSVKEAVKAMGGSKSAEKQGKELMEAYTKALKKYGENAKKAVEKVVTDITEKYQKAYDDLQSATESFESSWSGLDFLKGDEETGFRLVDPAKLEQDYENISTWLDEIQKIAPKGIFNQILELSPEDLQNFKKALEAQVDPKAWLEGMDAYQQKVSEKSKAFFDAGVKDIDKNYLQEVKKAVNKLPKELESVGANAVKGMMKGMNGESSNLEKVARQLARNVKTAMMKELEEKSPSKATARIGAFAGQGVAIGLESEENNVRKSAVSIANTLQNGLMSNSKEIARKTKDQIKGIENAYKGMDITLPMSDVNVLATFKKDKDTIDYDKIKQGFMESNELLGEMIDEAVREYMNNFAVKIDGREFGRIVRGVR